MYNKTKQRILQFIESQQISKRKFCEVIGKSEPYFTKDSAMGSDVLENISQNYSFLNMEWVITGHGEMLNNSAVEPIVNSKKELITQSNIDSLYTLIRSNEKLVDTNKVLADSNQVLAIQ